MVRTKMRNKINGSTKCKMRSHLMQERDNVRNESQEENRSEFNENGINLNLYNLNDLMASRKSQYRVGLRLRSKFSEKNIML